MAAWAVTIKQRKETVPAAGANFDAAFAKARRVGKKTFTWRGKHTPSN